MISGTFLHLGEARKDRIERWMLPADAYISEGNTHRNADSKSSNPPFGPNMAVLECGGLTVDGTTLLRGPSQLVLWTAEAERL